MKTEFTYPSIRTEFICPPIGNRNFDWVALLSDQDYEPDHNLPFGRGSTEQEAIMELIDQLKEAQV